MKTRILLARAFLLGWAIVAVPSGLAEEVRPRGDSLHSLWKVEDRTNALYLVGSIHFLKKENYPLPAPIESAYSNAQIAVFETEIDQMEQVGTALKLMSKGTLPAGQSLKQQLSAETYTAFSNQVLDAGMPLFLFDRMKPGLAAMTLEVAALKKLGLDPELGLDMHFFKRARQDGKSVAGLETTDFQISLIADISAEEGVAILKATLRDMNKAKGLLGDMVAAWQAGESAKLEKLLNESMDEFPALSKRFLTDRNYQWITKIEELLRGGNTAMVIVGAGHLVGKEGVVELLKKKGFKVTQL